MYKATISSGNQTKNYLGSTSRTLKKYGTTISVILKTTKKDMKISKYILKLKSINIDYKIDQEIIHPIDKAKNLQAKKKYKYFNII